MNTFANAVLNRTNVARTENGDVTLKSSLDSVVDMFFKIAAVRGRGSQVVTDMFNLAYAQDPDLATRVALWARDVRGGAGERQVFRDVIKHLEKNDIERLERILPLIPEVGRWDDLFVFETPYVKQQVFGMFAYALNAGNGLAAKWAPREGSANKAFARELREYMKLSPRAYRKLIAGLSKTVEQQMCAKEWDDINFSHVPSVASARYSKAFWRHQTDRYGAFVQKAVKGEEKINASALFPYDVLKSNVDPTTADALWAQLPDYVPEGVSFIPMVDVSGSMGSQVSPGVTCMDVSVSLGIYLAERNKGPFKDIVLTFAGNPTWHKIAATPSIRQKSNALRQAHWDMSTDLDKAMNLVLDTAVRGEVPASDMPGFLIVLSDMEFNGGYGSNTVADRTKSRFEQAGYRMPTIVWWNIQSRGGTSPVRYDATGMVLVGGCSPAVTKSVLVGDVDPRKAMLNTIMVERYDH